MHEMGLAEAALEMVLGAADGRNVKRIRMRIGQCLLLVPDSFQFSFELASAGTNAEGAELQIDETPAQLKCHACGKVSRGAAMPFICTHCGSPDIEITAGEDMILEDIELEDGQLIRNKNVDAAETLAAHFREHGPHEH
jgi:hydrogenase nickel incorporation protein HypA/HybF